VAAIAIHRPHRRIAKAFRPVQVAASALLVFGMVWFLLRLRS
jgi:hypothetical protein